ncbi:MAG TPA: hypothetical protein VF756_27475 [Thermoanaerobaculia bacterium]
MPMSEPPIRRGSAPALLLALCLAACSSAGPRPAGVAGPGADAGAAEPAGSLAQALDRAAQGDWQDLRIDAECRTDDGLRSATVLGSGVAIWNRQRQITLGRERIAALLESFRRNGFAGLRESYGGKGDPAPGAPPALAVELICRVRLALDGQVKEVHQLSEGRQSPELRRLAGEILAAVEEAGDEGVGAASLTEGLEKIARGELAPEVLSLQILRQSEEPGLQERGWLLRIDAGRAEIQPYPSAEDGKVLVLPLSRGDLTGLARELAEARLEDMPANLYAPEYTDFAVEVLNRERSLQARRFADVTPQTHGEKQIRFDRLFEAIDELRRKIVAERDTSP